MSPVVIFKSISNEQHKKSLLEKLTAAEGEILLKAGEDESEHLNAVSVNDFGQLQCIITGGGNLKFSFTKLLTAYFQVNNDKYMFETTAIPFEGGVNLTVTNLFHLQKRKNFRYTLPANYQADFLVTSLNQQKSSTTCRLIDLSTEGCGILLTADMPGMNLDDRLEAVIFIGDREPVSIQGFVKNLRVRGDDMVIGVEFNHLANSSEFAITSAIVEMQRAVHFKKSA